MYPDYGNALFWDENGVNLGGFDKFFPETENELFTIDLSGIVGLKQWLFDWEEEIDGQTYHWTDDQWMMWWSQGLEFAISIKALLPDVFDLYYFSVKDPIWIERPNRLSGGSFNYGEPIKIDDKWT